MKQKQNKKCCEIQQGRQSFFKITALYVFKEI